MGLFDDDRNAGLSPRSGQRQPGLFGGGKPGLFSFAAAAQPHEPGTPTFTRRVPYHAPPLSPADRQWWAIFHNEGGIGPHGEFRTSRRGAVGPAQVRPQTAPEAARLAGLPWDEHRYRTDAEYNIALGRAYYFEQLRQFGDPAMAAAAYNAGPRRVRDAIRTAREQGGPWDFYLPAETQKYLKNFRAKVGK